MCRYKPTKSVELQNPVSRLNKTRENLLVLKPSQSFIYPFI